MYHFFLSLRSETAYKSFPLESLYALPHAARAGRPARPPILQTMSLRSRPLEILSPQNSFCSHIRPLERSGPRGCRSDNRICRYAPKPLTNRFPLESLYALHLAARAIRPSRLFVPLKPLSLHPNCFEIVLLRAGKLQEQAAVPRDAFSGLQTAGDLRFAVTALAKFHRPPGKLVLPGGYIHKRFIFRIA
jgi:hypothetical protein